jgi:hypothetical protein
MKPKSRLPIRSCLQALTLAVGIALGFSALASSIGSPAARSNDTIDAQLVRDSVVRAVELLSISRTKHLFAGCCPRLTDADTCVQRSLRRTDRL